MSLVIVGAGPNLGLAVARRFGREGFSVGLVSRTQAKLDDLAAQLEGEGITAAGAAADIRDADALAAAIEALAGRLGEVEVLEYSPLPAREFMKPILETTVDDVRGPLEFSVLGAGQGIHVAHTAIGGSVAPGGDHEPEDIADVLWTHHAQRGPFQTRIGIPD